MKTHTHTHCINIRTHLGVVRNVAKNDCILSRYNFDEQNCEQSQRWNAVHDCNSEYSYWSMYVKHQTPNDTFALVHWAFYTQILLSRSAYFVRFTPKKSLCTDCMDQRKCNCFPRIQQVNFGQSAFWWDSNSICGANIIRKRYLNDGCFNWLSSVLLELWMLCKSD